MTAQQLRSRFIRGPAGYTGWTGNYGRTGATGFTGTVPSTRISGKFMAEIQTEIDLLTVQ